MKATIQLDDESIQAQVQSEVQKLMVHYMAQYNGVHQLSIDLKRMVEITSLSIKTLEKYVLNDPRIKQHELPFAGKRLWDWQGFKAAYLELAKCNAFTQI